MSTHPKKGENGYEEYKAYQRKFYWSNSKYRVSKLAYEKTKSRNLCDEINLIKSTKSCFCCGSTNKIEFAHKIPQRRGNQLFDNYREWKKHPKRFLWLCD